MGYVDPGAMSTIAQIGYELVLSLVSGLAFLLRPVRQILRRVSKRASSRTERPEHQQI